MSKRVISFTLGSATGRIVSLIIGKVGIFSAVWNTRDNCRSAFCIGSPDSKLMGKDDGGLVNIFVISLEACRRWSSNDVLGNVNRHEIILQLARKQESENFQR